MPRDKAEYFSSWKERVLPAKHDWPCAKCGGTIRAKSYYLNIDERESGKRWQHREHLDCQAAWWQVDMKRLLASIGSLPHINPPEAETLDALSKISVSVEASTDIIGRVIWQLPEQYRERLLHTPNLQLRTAAIEDIQLTLGLVVDCIIRVSGQKEASLQLSNILQQLKQVAATATTNTELTKK